MGLDIWFAEDIRNALLAANEASAQTAAIVAETGASSDLLAVALRSYREGYKAALATIALAFGLAPQAIMRGVIQNEQPIDGGTCDGGILQATAGHRRGIRPSDGQGDG